MLRKILTLYSCFLIFSSGVFSISNSTLTEISFQQEITDGMLVDLNRDGLNDLLVISGSHLYIYIQTDLGFNKIPNQRIYYREIGEIIDIGEVDKTSPGFEILGISESGVRCLYLNGSQYTQKDAFLIKQKFDQSFFRIAPILSDFAFDTNSDGIDEILLFHGNEFFLYSMVNSGDSMISKIENNNKIKQISLNSRLVQLDTLKRDNSRNILFFNPEIRTKNILIFQDIKKNGWLDSTTAIHRNNFRDNQILSSLNNENDQDIFFHINGDKELDKITIEINDDFMTDFKLFPYAKFFIFLNFDNQINSEPDHFFKTSSLNDKSPFIDIDSDGDLDFISIWSDVSFGSKENLIQIATNYIFEFTLRSYRFNSDIGFSNQPDISIKFKIKYEDLSKVGRIIPIDFSGDFDGDGFIDLCVRKDPKYIYIYFMSVERERIKIKKVSRIQIPNDVIRFSPANINGNNKSDILMVSKDKIFILLSE
jgi:hypothetical protein